MKKIITAAVFAALTLGLVGGTAYAADRQKQAVAAERVASTPEHKEYANSYMEDALKHRIYAENPEQIELVLKQDKSYGVIDYETLKSFYFHNLVHVVSFNIHEGKVRYTYFIATANENLAVEENYNDRTEYNHLYELRFDEAPLSDFTFDNAETEQWLINNAELDCWD